MALAWAQRTLAGYELGVGNQAIQIPFLLHLHDAQLFSRDIMVQTTLAAYPSLFYRALAQVLGWVSIPALYSVLHLVTAAGVFYALLAWSRAMFQTTGPGLLTALLLLAGHHRALAEQTLYSTGFTHTWAVFPLTLAALALLYADRPFPAFAVAGLSFNLHALEAGQLALVLTFWAIGTLKPRQIASLLAVFVVLATPTLIQLLVHRQTFDADWLQLMRIRSGHHSFPFTWWRAGQPDVPRFLLILALAGVSLTLVPGAQLRKTLLLTGGVVGLFGAGILFTEIWPVALGVRAQLFRASRFLMVLALLVIAAGCLRARGLERVGALLSIACLAAPPWLPALPVVLVVVTVLALVRGRLLWQQATLAGLAGLVTVVAWRTIEFVPFGFSLNFHKAPPGIEAEWVDVQRWARDNTPPQALFLTPSQMNGFRVHSHRAIVGEWRDGTQLFFSAAFARPWWERMEALQPGLRVAPDGRRLLVQGRSLSQLDDAQVLARARQFGADYIVLSVQPPRRLDLLYRNSQWAVYRPALAPEPPVRKADVQRFLEEVAQPNIEKHRRSDVRLQLVDAGGRPLYDARYVIRQTCSAFQFAGHNYTVVHQAWRDLEPVEGDRRYAALDPALAAARPNIEFSVLAGHPPAWARLKSEADQVQLVRRHALDLVDRYADRVAYWQVTEHGLHAEQLPHLVAAIRAQHPHIQLGIRVAPLLDGTQPPRGLADLRPGLDFVAIQARNPRGIWADPRALYDLFDAYARACARVHITQIEAPTAGWIEGAGQTGQWTPALAAKYRDQFATIAFSHPAVDALNLPDMPWWTQLDGQVALDGVITFRGYHGEYAITLNQTVHGTFTVRPGVNHYRLQLDDDAGTLEVVP